MNILVAYASEHGSTAEVGKFIGDILKNHGHSVTVADVYAIDEVEDYDSVVLGSAIHSGEWLPEAREFVENYAIDMEGKPIFCWVSCIRVLEDKGYDWVLNNYLPKWLMGMVDLQDVTAFAGKLSLDQISYDEEWTLALHYDGGHSPNDFNGDFRNWAEIEAWAMSILEHLREIEI